jgi:hypothetical protein
MARRREVSARAVAVLRRVLKRQVDAVAAGKDAIRVSFDESNRRWRSRQGIGWWRGRRKRALRPVSAIPERNFCTSHHVNRGANGTPPRFCSRVVIPSFLAAK